jgi:hypothetical protein
MIYLIVDNKVLPMVMAFRLKIRGLETLPYQVYFVFA